MVESRPRLETCAELVYHGALISTTWNAPKDTHICSLELLVIIGDYYYYSRDYPNISCFSKKGSRTATVTVDGRRSLFSNFAN